MSFLDDILVSKRLEVRRAKESQPLRDIRSRIRNAPSTRPFAQAFVPGDVRLIAEVKRKSPAKGSLNPKLDVTNWVKAYEKGGAAAVSVLTDGPFFGGSADDLKTAHASTSLPLLRKEFVIDEYQIFEARMMLADAVLLIARILEASQVRDYVALAAELGLAALVEVHAERELEAALDAKPPLLGINNRDLDTFRVSLETTLKLRPRVPKDVRVISESGISTRQDVLVMKQAGVDGVLIGEELVTCADPEAKVWELVGGVAKSEDGPKPLNLWEP